MFSPLVKMQKNLSLIIPIKKGKSIKYRPEPYKTLIASESEEGISWLPEVYWIVIRFLITLITVCYQLASTILSFHSIRDFFFSPFFFLPIISNWHLSRDNKLFIFIFILRDYTLQNLIKI